ncbi:hypothetical protein ECZC05_33230 [Escherichia coli]|nr:hypothetical protein ECZC02_10070 [Escherichia coli]GJH68350.1 hypothetical protein ECZC05_33230 [Escherichia coli]GJH77597.1 hypothetical protein ECZC07_15190 [Escherichia coli]GJH86021.1 hypothetical protein ECZC08_45910 [Escherichia coli]GJH97998.1 hypothetical protein ECZC11_03700 [Escherichia coli]
MRAYGKTFYTRTAGRAEGTNYRVGTQKWTHDDVATGESDGSWLAFGPTLPCGDLYMSGEYGVFASEQAYREWRKTPEKTTDQTLIRKLPDGEIRRYDRHLNIICRECRKSEVMQRVLAFYQGNFQEVMA